jgi:hypothetical protein
MSGIAFTNDRGNRASELQSRQKMAIVPKAGKKQGEYTGILSARGKVVRASRP